MATSSRDSFNIGAVGLVLCEEHLITFEQPTEHWLFTWRFNLLSLTVFFKPDFNRSNHRIGCLPDKSINKWQRISFNEFQDIQLSTWCAQTNLHFTKAPRKSWKLSTSFAVFSPWNVKQLKWFRTWGWTLVFRRPGTCFTSGSYTESSQPNFARWSETWPAICMYRMPFGTLLS